MKLSDLKKMQKGKGKARKMFSELNAKMAWTIVIQVLKYLQILYII